jgi:UDP-glucose 4-epimerase
VIGPETIPKPLEEDVSLKILVTGGAGFIGSHICDQLIARNHSVIAVDNFHLGRRENVAHLDKNANFRLIELDASDRPKLHELFSEHAFDCVFHMAANSDIARSHADPTVDLDNTFLTTFSVLDAMRRTTCRKLVFASTSAIYGEAPGRIREDHGPLRPISHYGAGKLASEGFITSYAENYGFQCWITRFPNVIGDRATHGVIYDFVEKLKATPDVLRVLGDGSQEKPYLYVHDLVKAILLAWDNASEKVNVFNVGPSTTSSVKFIAETTARLFGGDPRIEFGVGSRGWVGDIPRFEYDTSRIEALGWGPSMTSDEAVIRTVQVLVDAAKS